MYKALDKWLLGYLRSIAVRQSAVSEPKHLMFCIADHFEPFRRKIAKDGSISGGLSDKAGTQLVESWCDEYRKNVVGFTDSDGRSPRHTFFYPADEYNSDCLDILSGICGDGHGEVEVQLHHRNDTAEGLKNKLLDFCDLLHNRHGLLGCDEHGQVRYGFVHGNWALCNSRHDGDWCGVNEEIDVLIGTGCYADFTFPSAPSSTQPKMVNRLYRAWDIKGRSRSHDKGEDVKVCSSVMVSEELENNARHRMSDIDRSTILGGVSSCVRAERRDGLMMLQGPLSLDWRNRRKGLLPRLENGSLTGVNPPSASRCDQWVGQHISVKGRPDWVFVKIYTHGCAKDTMPVVLGEYMRNLYGHLSDKYTDSKEWQSHYVTAREMYNIVRAAEDGHKGSPNMFRDYEIYGC